MKSSLLWMLLVVALVLHMEYEAAEFVFFSKPLKTDGEGVLPTLVQVFSILVMIVPLMMALVHLVCAPKWFVTVSLVYSGLLGVLNVYHLVETLGNGFDNFLQIVLLTFVLFINGVLIKSLLADRKASCC